MSAPSKENDLAAAVVVGAVCKIERRFHRGSESVQHSGSQKIVRVTAKRAYLDVRRYFALDDPHREVKPRYLDYFESVVAIEAAS